MFTDFSPSILWSDLDNRSFLFLNGTMLPGIYYCDAVLLSPNQDIIPPATVVSFLRLSELGLQKL